MISRTVARHRPAVAGILVALAAALAGCGSTSTTPALPAAGIAVMDSHLKAVQSSADQHDRAGATAELDAFAGDVARARSAGTLTPADYAALETGIARARARIAVELPATAALATAPATAPTTPTPATSATIPYVAPAPQRPSPAGPAGRAMPPGKTAPPGKIKAAKGPGRAKGHGKGHGGG